MMKSNELAGIADTDAGMTPLKRPLMSIPLPLPLPLLLLLVLVLLSLLLVVVVTSVCSSVFIVSRGYVRPRLMPLMTMIMMMIVIIVMMMMMMMMMMIPKPPSNSTFHSKLMMR